LSRAAIAARQEEGIVSLRNTSVFEYNTDEGLQTESGFSVRGEGHAEQLVWQQLEAKGVQPSDVTQIYSELQPCSLPGSQCAGWIASTFPQANVTWSFEYGETAASRQVGMSQLARELARIFGGGWETVSVAHEDVAAVWGRSNVVRVPRADLEGLGLPEEAQRVLAEVGLPRKADRMFAYEKPQHMAVAGSSYRYCKIGSDYGNDLCVATDSGAVLSVSPSGRHLNRFVNSGLENFVRFLCRVKTERRRFAGLSDSEIDAIIEQLDIELHAYDPDAFGSSDHWWSVIFEQMRYGLL
jgi:SUKH-4 immunity protein/Xanthomonas XOO_2897-like deaminase